MKKAGVIGGGAWGTALAQAAAGADLDTVLWALEEDVVRDINQEHINPTFLPDIPLHHSIRATHDLAEMGTCDFILMVCPAQFMRSVAEQLKPNLPTNVPLVICAKGIEKTTGYLMSEVLAEVTPDNPIAVLSGPTFAHEVAKGLPSAVTIAAHDIAVARRLTEAMGRPEFRPYWSDDVAGAQIGGSVKNVLAIACGIIAGMEMGENARAAAITRGLSEMTRFGQMKGARFETLAGLAGLGDLILTCSSTSSRNFSLGYHLGQGQNLDDLMSNRKTVAEGYHSAAILHKLATDADIDMPLATAVYQILYEGRDVGAAIREILHRPFSKETI